MKTETKKEKRTKSVVVRLTPTEKARIAKIAEEDAGGAGISTILRVYTLQHARMLKLTTIKDCKLYFELLCCECDGDFSATVPLSDYPLQVANNLQTMGTCPECKEGRSGIITNVTLLLPETPLDE